MRLSHDVFGPGPVPGARIVLAREGIDYELGDLQSAGLADAAGGIVAAEGVHVVDDDGDKVPLSKAVEVGVLTAIDPYTDAEIELGVALTRAAADDDDEVGAEAEGDPPGPVTLTAESLEQQDRTSLEAIAAELGIEGFGRWGDARLISTILEQAADAGDSTDADAGSDAGTDGDAGEGTGAAE